MTVVTVEAADPLTAAELDGIGVERLGGVGAGRAGKLAAMGVYSVWDLLTHYPRRYVDRTQQSPITQTSVGEQITVVGELLCVSSRPIRRGRRLVTADVSDGTGRLRAVFFNQPWRERQLASGRTVALFGKVEAYRGALQMSNPVVDLVGDRTGRIVAVYPQSETAGVTSWEIAGWVAEALRRCARRGIGDPLPAALRNRFGFVSRHEALHAIHQPDTMADRWAARNRLVFDELMRVQLLLRTERAERQAREPSVRHCIDGAADELAQWLPFELTAAQRRVMGEIEADLSGAWPMHRLLQGDVGSGKTVVALCALLAAVRNGHQGALMAPTEVLAEQHFRALRALTGTVTVADPSRLSGSRPLRMRLLTGTVAAASRRDALAELASGQADVVVGTHALIADGVEFASLSMLIIDEQHRFGVAQRARLREHGRRDGKIPHLLVMTATPIPRTAAMTVYGDLDVSVLDELPPGRTPVTTSWAHSPDEVREMWSQVRAAADAGHQAYVVCPHISDSESQSARSAQTVHAELRDGELAGLRVELLHGRMRSADKERIMNGFRAGRIDVLVSTTVIEVGVDVPNATVMVVVSADRFGIAQMHQLRGRVGRSEHASVCWLHSDDEPTPTAQARIEALVSCADGFELAERDLELRGEGTIFDERQSGRNDLQLASLVRDAQWVQRARDAAAELVAPDGSLRSSGLLDEIRWFAERGVRDAENLQRS